MYSNKCEYFLYLFMLYTILHAREDQISEITFGEKATYACYTLKDLQFDCLCIRHLIVP
ncbi:hypothetical protein M758_UG201500 [Ceratodon purpureus]|nr:hypothetical protein M758_UG201500 [Ceratodon purpureus]